VDEYLGIVSAGYLKKSTSMYVERLCVGIHFRGGFADGGERRQIQSQLPDFDIGDLLLDRLFRKLQSADKLL
jgi:hypothetical protein